MSLSLKCARVYPPLIIYLIFGVHCDINQLKFNGGYTHTSGKAHFRGFFPPTLLKENNILEEDTLGFLLIAR